MRIALASDHAGFALKRIVVDHLRQSRSSDELLDLGPESTIRITPPPSLTRSLAGGPSSGS